MYSKTYVVEFPLDNIAWLQSIAYYLAENVTTDYYSWSFQKPLQNCCRLNITSLQSRISDFSKNAGSSKIVSSEYSLKKK